MSGEIPWELGNLANLIALHLTENQLSGEIPKELGNLENLTTLGVDENQLIGCVPSLWLGRQLRGNLGGLLYCQ